MPKLENNSSSLTDDDIGVVNQILIWCGAKLTEISELHSAKQYGERVIAQRIKSKRNLATLRVILNAKNRLSNQVLTSDEINRQLAKDMLDLQADSSGDMSAPIPGLGLYISRSDMRMVTKKAEEVGVLRNIRGKKKIKYQIRIQHGWKLKRHDSSSGYETRRSGGGWSAYVVTPDLERLKEVLSKLSAIERVHASLKQSGLLHKAMKAVYLSELYAIRFVQDEKVVNEYCRATIDDNKFFTVAQFKEAVTDAGIKSYIEFLRGLDDTQLEKLADITVAYLIENPMHHNYVLACLFGDRE